MHARGECQALLGLAKLGVEGDSQAMRLALRIATLNDSKTTTQRGDAAAPFHTPAFVAGLDHHFDAAPAPVRQGVLAVAQALGECGVRTWRAGMLHTLPLHPRSSPPYAHAYIYTPVVQPTSFVALVSGRLPQCWRASC